MRLVAEHNMFMYPTHNGSSAMCKPMLYTNASSRSTTLNDASVSSSKPCPLVQLCVLLYVVIIAWSLFHQLPSFQVKEVCRLIFNHYGNSPNIESKYALVMSQVIVETIRVQIGDNQFPRTVLITKTTSLRTTSRRSTSSTSSHKSSTSSLSSPSLTSSGISPPALSPGSSLRTTKKPLDNQLTPPS